MNTRQRPIAAAVLLLTLIANANAANAADAVKVDASDPAMPVVTVSAGRGTSLSRMDLATTELDRSQVEQMPETAVEQILNKLPGVFARQEPSAMIHPTGQVFSIRGFGTATNVNTLVMVDGIPVNDPYFRTIDWGQVPLEAVERMEVIRGGGGATLWGNLAMGGIVNIVTRRAGPGEARVTASAGSHGTRAVDAAATLLSTPALTLGISAGWRDSDGYQLTPAQYRSPHMGRTGSRTDNLGLSADIAPSDTDRLYLKLLAHRSENDGLQWNIMRSEWDKYQASAGGSHVLPKGALHWNAWAGRGVMETENASATPSFSILKPAVGVPYLAQIEQARYRTQGGSVFFQRDAGEWKDIRVGLDLRRVSADDHINVYGPSALRAAVVNGGVHRFAGVFGQASWRPRALPLDVTVGMREDWFQTRSGSLAGRVEGRPVDAALPDQDYHHFSPRIGAKYYLDGGFNLRGAWYRNFAAPGMNQMYRSFASGTSYTATNPQLVPQTNVGQELGLDYAAHGVNLALTLFHNELKNYIDYAPLCTTVAGCNPLLAGTGLAPGSTATINQYVNAGNAILQGVELIASWKPNDRWELHGGATRTRAYLHASRYAEIPSKASPAVPVDKQMGQVPRWTATAGARWRATDALRLSLELKAFPDYWYNTAHTTLNGGAFLADVGLSYRLRRNVELFGSVQNLANREYYDQGLAYTSPEGATISGGTVPQRGQPRTATVGVRTRF